MKDGFIVTSDRRSIEELLKLGFQLISIDSTNNNYTFLNDKNIKLDFKDKAKIAFTNKLIF